MAVDLKILVPFTPVSEWCPTVLFMDSNTILMDKIMCMQEDRGKDGPKKGVKYHGDEGYKYYTEDKYGEAIQYLRPSDFRTSFQHLYDRLSPNNKAAIEYISSLPDIWIVYLYWC